MQARPRSYQLEGLPDCPWRKDSWPGRTSGLPAVPSPPMASTWRTSDLDECAMTGGWGRLAPVMEISTSSAFRRMATHAVPAKMATLVSYRPSPKPGIRLPKPRDWVVVHLRAYCRSGAPHGYEGYHEGPPVQAPSGETSPAVPDPESCPQNRGIEMNEVRDAA
jgi:hypothetical protein